MSGLEEAERALLEQQAARSAERTARDAATWRRVEEADRLLADRGVPLVDVYDLDPTPPPDGLRPRYVPTGQRGRLLCLGWVDGPSALARCTDGSVWTVQVIRAGAHDQGLPDGVLLRSHHVTNAHEFAETYTADESAVRCMHQVEAKYGLR